MILETTLNRLRAHNPCVSGYATLLASLGGPSCDPDAPINLLHILQSNGVDDCLWALRATIQDSEQVARLMASDFAEDALPIFERARPTDARPRNAIAVARRYARGEATVQELSAARGAAGAAGAARAAAWDGAGDGAGAGARITARAAAWAAQARIIRSYLEVAA